MKLCLEKGATHQFSFSLSSLPCGVSKEEKLSSQKKKREKDQPSDSSTALTDGSSIMQDALIITHRHVFTVSNSGFLRFTNAPTYIPNCKYSRGQQDVIEAPD